MITKLTNTNAKKRLMYNFLSLFVLKGFQFLLPLITLPYLVRTIGLEKFGTINFALSLGIYFSALIQYGFSITATREIARHREDKDKLAQIYSNTLATSVFLSFISVILYSLIIKTFGKFNSEIKLYWFTLAQVIFLNLFPVWFFQGIEKMKYITFLSLGTSSVYLVSLFVFVKQQSDYTYVPLLYAISSGLSLILALRVIKTKFGISFKKPCANEVKKIILNGRHAFISQFIPSLYTNSVTFLLGFFTDNTSVGLFAAATKVIDAFGSIIYVLSNTFLPYLSREIEKHQKFQRMMLTIAVATTLLLLASSDYIAKVIYGERHTEIILYIKILTTSIPFMFIVNTYGHNYLMLINKERIFKNILVYSSLFSLSYSIVLIYFQGIWGAIFTLIVTRFIIACFTLKEYFKYAQH